MALYLALAMRHLALWDAFGFIVIYSMFCYAAMLVFGSPLLYLYKRLNWTGFLAFAAGGALCAAVTQMIAWAPVLPKHDFVFLTLCGVVEGLVLRLILFGIALHPASTTNESEVITPPS